MMAADPQQAGVSAVAPPVLDDMHDGPEELAAGHPLHEALALCRELLGSCHDAAAARAAASSRRRSLLGAWAAGAAALAVVLAIFSTTWAARGSRPPGAERPLAIASAVAAAASLVLLAARGVLASRRVWVAERVRVERCREAKFRFLLDPSLWSRRGDESSERVGQFRQDAATIASAGPEAAAAWGESDAIPTARTIPVGSGIDPHTVHTLMDYYQARRIDPQLARLAREGEGVRGGNPFPPPAGVLAACVSFVLAGAVLALLPSTRAGVLPSLLVAAALALPFAAAALRAAPLPGSSESRRRRARARHRALAELSGRLQKVSGAEAIFRELGFCEDVLEAEGRDRIRHDLAAGWIG